ncbi:MAG: EexN family lipoprotein, partial [Steroidobacteraceae bacterium]
MSCRKGSLSLALALLASACSPAPEQARYTVDEYRANAELRHAQVARCQSDPGTLKKTPDCINAQQAAAFEDRLR